MIKKKNMGYFNLYQNTSNNSKQRLKFLKCFVILLGIIIVILMICFGHKVFSCFSLHQTHEVGFLIRADADDSESVRIKGGDLRDLTVNEVKILRNNFHRFSRDQLEQMVYLNMQPEFDHYYGIIKNIEFFEREHLERIVHDYRSTGFNNYFEFERYVRRTYSVEQLRYNILKKDCYDLRDVLFKQYWELKEYDRSTVEFLLDQYCQMYINRNGKFYDYGNDRLAREVVEIIQVDDII